MPARYAPSGVLAALLAAAVLSGTVPADAGPPERGVAADAVAAARAFVEGEFAGRTDLRLHAAIVEPPAPVVTESGETPGLLDGRVFDLAADPLVAVRRYAIGAARRDGDGVAVPVDYEVAATTRGTGVPGRTFLPARAATERVVLHLVAGDARWAIRHPPLPRVSVGVVLDTLEQRAEYGERLVLALPRASAAQRATFAATREQSKALRAIVDARP